jgi:hypothetical protein
MQLDDSDDYFLAGEEVVLGSGGLTAAPAGDESGSAGAFMLMPLRLDAPQRWSIANRSGGEIEENGLLLGEALTSAGSALTIELSDGPALVLDNSTEVGPLRIEGSNAAGEHLANGAVLLGQGELNSSDREPVELSRVYFEGAGAVGALRTNDATLVVGRGEAATALEASSAKIDSNSAAVFEIDRKAERITNSQLVSTGPVELAGGIAVVVESSKEGCPALAPGQKYTLVSTTGTLSGAFGNAPEGGPEIKIGFAKGCDEQPRTMRVSYSRTGGTETVTGTVEAQAEETQAEETQEEEAKQKEEATTKLAEEHAKKLEEAVKAAAAAAARSAEEATNAKKHQEEETTASRRREEEPTAHGGVLAAKERSQPKHPTRAQLLAKALEQCKKQPKHRRAKCEAAARKKYGSTTKAKRP